MSQKKVDDWFAEYSVCHQNHTNKVIHWLCVPAIAASLIGLLWAIPFPWAASFFWVNWAVLAIAASMIFYVRLSPPLAVGMVLWSAMVIGVIVGYEAVVGGSVWVPSLVVFVVAWIGQFVGHKIEGKKPAFFQDLQFLLIGPLWVLDALYGRLGIRRKADFLR